MKKIDKNTQDHFGQFYNSKFSTPVSTIQNQTQKKQKFDQFMISLLRYFNSDEKSTQNLLQLNDNFKKIEQNVIGKTYWICGSQKSGKRSLINFGLRNCPSIKIIKINCMFLFSQANIIAKLDSQFKQKLNIEQNISFIKKEDLDFKELTQVIYVKKQEIVLIIKNAQRLLQFKKQQILYNLSQWIQKANKCVGIIYVSNNIVCYDKLQKRIKSRIKLIRIQTKKINPSDIIAIIKRNVQVFQKNYFSQTNQVNDININSPIEEEDCSQITNWITIIKQVLCQNTKLKQILQQFNNFNFQKVFNCIMVTMADQLTYANVSSVSLKHLKQVFCQTLNNSLKQNTYSFNKGLIQNLTVPEQTILALYYNMQQNQRKPFVFKNIFTIFNELKTSLYQTQFPNSLFLNVQILKRAVFKLIQQRIFVYDDDLELVWDAPIVCEVFSIQLKNILQSIESLPAFIRLILGSQEKQKKH